MRNHVGLEKAISLAKEYGRKLALPFPPDEEWVDAVDIILEAVKNGELRKGEDE
jgi:hypothetical protein